MVISHYEVCACLLPIVLFLLFARSDLAVKMRMQFPKHSYKLLVFLGICQEEKNNVCLQKCVDSGGHLYTYVCMLAPFQNFAVRCFYLLCIPLQLRSNCCFAIEICYFIPISNPGFVSTASCSLQSFCKAFLH